MKKRSTLLIALGAVIFVFGAGIVVLSLRHSGKPAGTQLADGAGGANTPVVVATKAIPAGTTGESMIENHEVTIQKAPSGAYKSDDLMTLDSLNQEALATPVAANQPIESSNMRLNAGTLQAPPGDESIALTLSSSASAGAGYLSPGDNVDVYANITKTSAGTAAAASMPVPCTALIESSVELLDVSTVVAPYRNQPAAGGRAVPQSVTVLVAATPAEARRLVFYSENEALFLTKASTTEKPVSNSACSALLTNPQLTPGS